MRCATAAHFQSPWSSKLSYDRYLNNVEVYGHNGRGNPSSRRWPNSWKYPSVIASSGASTDAVLLAATVIGPLEHRELVPRFETGELASLS